MLKRFSWTPKRSSFTCASFQSVLDFKFCLFSNLFTQFLQNLVENMLNLVLMMLVVLPLKTEVCCWTAWYKLTAKLFCYLFLLNSDFFAWKLAPSTLLSSCFFKIFLGITPKKCWSDFRELLRGLVLLAHLFRVFLILSFAFFLIYLENYSKCNIYF